MIRLVPLLLLVLLAACGVAGPPVPPSQARQDAARPAANPDVLVSGSVGLGLGGRL